MFGILLFLIHIRDIGNAVQSTHSNCGNYTIHGSIVNCEGGVLKLTVSETACGLVKQDQFKVEKCEMIYFSGKKRERQYERNDTIVKACGNKGPVVKCDTNNCCLGGRLRVWLLRYLGL